MKKRIMFLLGTVAISSSICLLAFASETITKNISDNITINISAETAETLNLENANYCYVNEEENLIDYYNEADGHIRFIFNEEINLNDKEVANNMIAAISNKDIKISSESINNETDIILFDSHELYLQSDDGESISSTFSLEGGKEAKYQLINRNENEVSWKLIKKGLFGESIINSGTLAGNAKTDIIEISSSKNGKYCFKGSTTNGAAINVYCRFREVD